MVECLAAAVVAMVVAAGVAAWTPARRAARLGPGDRAEVRVRAPQPDLTGNSSIGPIHCFSRSASMLSL